ncbi:hypothetical protein FRC18_002491 [Serendipita sp. 400]|nr:hypothetical protein FRC18_002491 [Serendipita sp. 400]
MQSHHLRVHDSNQTTFDAAETERCNLLEALELRGTHHDGEMNSLKTRYNETIRRQWSLKSGILNDPLAELPREIWEEIFVGMFGDIDDVRYTEDLLGFLNVSKSWCNRLVSAPRLWTRIVVDDSLEDELAKLVICLELSGSYPLEVKVRSHHRQWEKVLELLMPHTSRIKAMVWGSGNLSAFWTENPIQSFGSLPALERLYFPDQFFYPGETFSLSQTPGLKSITGLVTTLNEAHKYAELPITRAFLYSEERTDHKREKIPSQWDCLSHLELSGIGPGGLRNILTALSHHRGESLVSLTVWNTPLDSLQKLLAQLQLFNLQTLSFNMHTEFAIPTHHLEEDIRLLSLRKAKVVLYGDHHGVDSRAKDWLLHTVAKTMPRLEELSLRFSIVPLSALGHLQTLPNLWRLELDVYVDNGEGEIRCLLPHLKALHCHSRISGPRIYSSELREYTVQDDAFSVVTPPAPNSCLLPLSSSQSLVRLSIQHHAIALDLTNFPVLEELAMGFGVHSPPNGHYPVWQSDVLEQLILIPATCRNLRKIEFITPFQEWDMLLLMLERRNFLQNPDVHRIEEITFQFAQPTHKLIAPISSLLAGKFVARLPIEEYSITAISRSFSDISKADCPDCVLIFKECPEYGPLQPPSWRRKTEEAMNDSFVASGIVADPPISTEIGSWLSNKKHRRISAIKQFSETRERGKKIRRCVSHRPFTIAALMCDGTYS